MNLKLMGHYISWIFLYLGNKKTFLRLFIINLPTFSGVHSNFNSFKANEFKSGLVYTLLFRIFNIASDFSKFHEDVQKLKEVLQKKTISSKLY